MMSKLSYTDWSKIGSDAIWVTHDENRKAVLLLILGGENVFFSVLSPKYLVECRKNSTFVVEIARFNIGC